MDVCSNGHNDVCFNGYICPLCDLRQDLEGGISNLEDENKDLKKQIELLEIKLMEIGG